jgi:hypothetical protein
LGGSSISIKLIVFWGVVLVVFCGVKLKGLGTNLLEGFGFVVWLGGGCIKGPGIVLGAGRFLGNVCTMVCGKFLCVGNVYGVEVKSPSRTVPQ